MDRVEYVLQRNGIGEIDVHRRTAGQRDPHFREAGQRIDARPPVQEHQLRSRRERREGACVNRVGRHPSGELRGFDAGKHVTAFRSDGQARIRQRHVRVATFDERVDTASTVQRVDAAAARQPVVAVSADKRVISAAADEDIVARAAAQIDGSRER